MEISNAHITLAAAVVAVVDAVAVAVVAVAVAAKWQATSLTHFHDTQMSKIIAVKYANEKIFPTAAKNRKVSKRKVSLLLLVRRR